MATFYGQKTFSSIVVEKENVDVITEDDYVSIEIGTMINPKIVKVNLQYDCNEKFCYKKSGFLGLKLSIVPDTTPHMDDFIKTLLPFAEITIYGTHKKSLSSRNAFKFFIQCKEYIFNPYTNTQIYTSYMLFVDNEYVIYKFIIQK